MIRPIRPDELTMFASRRGQDERNASVQAYVERIVASGAMRCGWCYVAEEAGSIVGSVALWTLSGIDVPLSMVLLEAPWTRGDDATGDDLLRHALRQALSLGATTVDYVLDDPPMAPHWQHHPEQRVALLARHGFMLKRETRRFRRGTDAPSVGAVAEAIVRATMRQASAATRAGAPFDG